MSKYYVVPVVCFNCWFRGRVVIAKGKTLTQAKCPQCGVKNGMGLHYANEEKESSILVGEG